MIVLQLRSTEYPPSLNAVKPSDSPDSASSSIIDAQLSITSVTDTTNGNIVSLDTLTSDDVAGDLPGSSSLMGDDVTD